MLILFDLNIPLKTHSQGSIFPSKSDIYPPPPLLKMIFFSPLATCRFSTPIVAFFFLNSSLFCIFFTLLLPLFSFSFPFFPFSFPFLPFSFTFSPFFSSPFHIFSPKCHRLIFPPSGGGGYFPVYRPLPIASLILLVVTEAVGICNTTTNRESNSRMSRPPRSLDFAEYYFTVLPALRILTLRW